VPTWLGLLISELRKPYKGKLTSFLKLDKKESHRHTGLKMERRDGDECPVDRQYQYLFISHSDHHGFLSHHSGQYIDPLVKERINELMADGEL
jgi:hypothetical protein